MNRLKELKTYIDQRYKLRRGEYYPEYFEDIEAINKKICETLSVICKSGLSDIKLYLIHNNEEIILDQPDDIYIDVDDGEIVGCATYWSLYLAAFTYDLVTYDVPRKGPYCLEFKFFSTRIGNEDIILQIKGELTDEN